MHQLVRRAALVVLAVAASGCYHATIDTGRPPSGQQVRKAWASGFLYGLVPPSDVETAAKCPNGVAKVETQQSFLNMVANAITFGIYTPMDIRVQCASAGTAMSVPLTPRAELAGALDAAAQQSAQTGEPAFVRF